MGYTTDFNGSFTVTPPLKPEHNAYLRKFAETRRMKRNEEIAARLPDPIRIAAGLPIGHEGAFYVGGGGHCGQDKDESVIDFNCAPGSIGYADPRPWDERQRAETELIAAKIAQPGLWCHWVPTEDGQFLEWDGGEKFYAYVEWLEYLIHHFLAPWGYTLNGEVSWSGESTDDHGVIYAKDNAVEAVRDTNPGPSFTDSSVLHCCNCDNEAVCKVTHDDNKGVETPLCQTCKEAYEWGQASPNSTVSMLGDSPEDSE